MRQRGFTLIEIVAVIAIIGLLAAAAVLTLAHTAGKHRFQTVCQELEQSDGLIRSAARQSGHGQQMIVNLDNEKVLWQANSDEKPMQLLRLADGDTVQVRTPEERISYREASIDFSSLGYSQSYALGLSRVGQETRWMVVAGLSGRTFWTEDEKQIDAIFQSLARHSLQEQNLQARSDTH